MEKRALVYPGVGSQQIGMGKDFFDTYPQVKETFEEAGDVLGIDMAALCFDDANKDELARLERSQAALVTVGYATAQVYKQEIGITPEYCMGHSLGEYSALCGAGVIRFRDALEIVKVRGEILTGVAQRQDGLMAWVINLDKVIVQQVCDESREKGIDVYISAYDAPTQTSISGPKEQVISVGRELEKNGAIVYPLKLSGPFHSPLMEEAALKLRSVLEKYEYNDPLYPVIANHNAELYGDKDSVVENLSLQLMKPVRWQASVDYLLRQDIRFAVEMGPDRVLKHLIQNNTSDIRVFSLGSLKNLNAFKEDPINA
jgi:[acyl-carrier-protein] S-malonyltransferase